MDKLYSGVWISGFYNVCLKKQNLYGFHIQRIWLEGMDNGCRTREPHILIFLEHLISTFLELDSCFSTFVFLCFFVLSLWYWSFFKHFSFCSYSDDEESPPCSPKREMFMPTLTRVSPQKEVRCQHVTQDCHVFNGSDSDSSSQDGISHVHRDGLYNQLTSLYYSAQMSYYQHQQMGVHPYFVPSQEYSEYSSLVQWTDSPKHNKQPHNTNVIPNVDPQYTGYGQYFSNSKHTYGPGAWLEIVSRKIGTFLFTYVNVIRFFRWYEELCMKC